MASLRSSRGVVASASWVMVDNLSQAVVSFGVLFAMARLLDKEQFAAAALSLTVVQLLYPVPDAFFHDVIVQRREIDPVHVSSAWLASIASGALLWAALFALAGPLGEALGLPSVAVVLPWMALVLPVAGVAGVPAAFARRQGWFQLLAVRSALGRLAGGAVGVGAALAGWGVWSVVAQQVSGAVIGAALLLVQGGITSRAGFSATKLRELMGFSLGSFVTIIIWTAQTRIATLFISLILGPIAATTWNVAQRLVDPLQGLVGTAASHLTLPLFARRQHDPAAMRDGFVRATEASALLVLPAYFGIALCGPELVALVAGEKWLPASPLVAIFAIGAGVSFLRQFSSITLLALGRPYQNLVVSAAIFLVGTLGIVLGTWAGLAGAAWGALLRLLPDVALGGRYVRRAIGLSRGDQFGPAMRPLAATAVMGIAVLLVREWIGGRWPPLPTLGALVATGVVAYLLAIAALARGPVRAVLAEVRAR